MKYFNKYYGGIYSPTENPTGKVHWDFLSTSGNYINGYREDLSFDDPVNQTILKSNIRPPGIMNFINIAWLLPYDIISYPFSKK